MALGAETVTTTVEGRERYGVSIRYPRALCSDPQAIATDVQIPLPGGGAVPLGEVAKVELKRGATRSEEHTSELQSLMRISYAVFCLKKKKKDSSHTTKATQRKTSNIHDNKPKSIHHERRNNT